MATNFRANLANQPSFGKLTCRNGFEYRNFDFKILNGNILSTSCANFGVGEDVRHLENALHCLTCMTKQMHCFILVKFKKVYVPKLKDVVVYLFVCVGFLSVVSNFFIGSVSLVFARR